MLIYGISELKRIDAIEMGLMSNIKELKSYANEFRSLYVMSIDSRDNNIHVDVYLVGGRMYYIDRNKYRHSGKIMTPIDFMSEANPVSIYTLFDFRKCLAWGIIDKTVHEPSENSISHERFKYVARINYITGTGSAITTYGYSNISDWFAIEKANEFSKSMISICNMINYEIDLGYDLDNGDMPTRLLMKIREFLG